MNTIGRLLKVTIYGESHGVEVGCIIDGCPAGISLKDEDFEFDLARRKAGSFGTTTRIEADRVIIRCGVYNGFTTGGAINLSFLNQNTKSTDYSSFVKQPRPSHADFVAQKKYKGFADYRGGGFFSGRLTVCLVACGVIAKKIIPQIKISSEITNLGGETDSSKFLTVLKAAASAGDSVGGIVKLQAHGLPIGVGEPYFDSLEATISHLLFSVGGVKGVAFGGGFSKVGLKGSEFNDCLIDETGKTKTNNNGGINGGISNGNPLEIEVFVKPTPSIYKTQQTYSFAKEKIEDLKIEGRHDTAIVLRAGVVLEACLSLALADAMLVARAYNLEEKA